MRFRLAVVVALAAAPASAQVRIAPIEARVQVGAPSFAAPAAPSFGLSFAPSPTASFAASPPSAPALAPLAAPSLPLSAAPSALPSAAPAAAPALNALPAAAADAEPSKPAAVPAADAPSADAQLKAAAAVPESDRLWDGGMPASEARKLLRSAHWETTKFFFTSRVTLLRSMIEQQKTQTEGKPRAVRDLEAMWLDWRVKAYSGRVTTSGFQVADRGTIRREAEKLFARRFPSDAESRAAFARYLDRVDAYVPLERPSNYRKLAFSVFYELPVVDPAELPARIDAMLADEHLGAIREHRATKQDAVVASFREAATAAIREANASLPEGRKIVAVVMLGSYAISQSTPKSDIDYQLVTQGGTPDGIAPFNAALDRLWTENRIEKLESFQFALPPSREVVIESFREGYRVISPDPAAVTALSVDSFAPDAPSGWSRLRGAAFGAFYRAWCWTWFRLVDATDALKTFFR